MWFLLACLDSLVCLGVSCLAHLLWPQQEWPGELAFAPMSPYSGTSRPIWVCPCRGDCREWESMWKRAKPFEVQTQNGASSFLLLLLGKASHKPSSDSRERGSKIPLFSEKHTGHVAMGMVWIQGRAKNWGHSCPQFTTARNCFRYWGDIRGQNRPKSLPLGSSHGNDSGDDNGDRGQLRSVSQEACVPCELHVDTWRGFGTVVCSSWPLGALAASAEVQCQLWMTDHVWGRNPASTKYVGEVYYTLRGLLSYWSTCSLKSNQQLLPWQNGGYFNWDIGRCISLISA